MKVTIITACFNSERTISDTISSVISQDYPNIEYIIIDGASTDKTAEVVRSFGDKIYKFVSEKDKGMYDAINKGIGIATGEIIAILNSDDFYTSPSVISRVVKEFTEKNTDSVYGDLDYVDFSDKEKVIRKWRSGAFRRERFLSGWMPPHPSFFLKKECYEKFGLFNTSFSIAADYELMLRMLFKNKVSVSYIPLVLVKMRTGGISNAGLKSRMKANQEDRRAWEINGLKPKWYTLTLKPLRKLGQFI